MVQNISFSLSNFLKFLFCCCRCVCVPEIVVDMCELLEPVNHASGDRERRLTKPKMDYILTFTLQIKYILNCLQDFYRRTGRTDKLNNRRVTLLIIMGEKIQLFDDKKY